MELSKAVSRVWLEVDLRALKANFLKISRAVSPSEVMVVLKANAYGLGIRALAPSLVSWGVRRIGVAEMKETRDLPRSPKIKIHLLGSLLKKEVPLAVKTGLICPLTDLGMARTLSRESVKQKTRTTCHILVDTGMGRLGIPHSEALEIIPKILKLPGLYVEGIYSHFANANDPSDPASHRQLARFNQLLSHFPAGTFRLVHMANSDGINNFPQSYFNMVRTGINLYGVFDLLGKRRYSLSPTLTLKTRLVAKRVLPQGHPIGYGGTYVLKKKSLVGTIPAGYADGIPYTRFAPAGVLIKGKFCKVIGNVSMDYTTVDLNSCPEARPGDLVILVGKSGSRQLTVEDWAKIKGTHPYDIICSLGPRVERIYKA